MEKKAKLFQINLYRIFDIHKLKICLAFFSFFLDL